MTKKKSISEILASWDAFDRPKDGDIFQHYKGGQYVVVSTGFLENTEMPCVVYRSLEKNIVWVRSAKNFLEEIEFEGRLRPRFTKV
jgi:hypothetical protein